MVNRLFTVLEDQPVYLPGELSRKILLMLDGDSLHQARQVCQGWNQAVLNLVWGEDRAAVERKLENNWRIATPLRIEKTLQLGGFQGRLLSLTQTRAVMVNIRDDEGGDSDDVDEKRSKFKFIVFNTKDGEVLSANDFVLKASGPEEGGILSVDEIENTVVFAVPEFGKFKFGGRHVLAYNIQTQQITYDEAYEYEGEELDEEPIAVVNETNQEILFGKSKFKIIEDDVIEKPGENYLPGIIAQNSDLCITSTFEEPDSSEDEGQNRFEEGGIHQILWKRDKRIINYKKICVLHKGFHIGNGQKYGKFKFYPDTTRIVSVSTRLIPRLALPFEVSLWNSDTGNLIQEETLPLPSFITVGEGNSAWLVEFKIEGNHLVLLVREFETGLFHILIYELSKVLAGEDTKPREFSIGGWGLLDNVNRYEKLLVNKTSVTVGANCGSVVKLDFWRCE